MRTKTTCHYCRRTEYTVKTDESTASLMLYYKLIKIPIVVTLVLVFFYFVRFITQIKSIHLAFKKKQVTFKSTICNGLEFSFYQASLFCFRYVIGDNTYFKKVHSFLS